MAHEIILVYPTPGEFNVVINGKHTRKPMTKDQMIDLAARLLKSARETGDG